MDQAINHALMGGRNGAHPQVVSNGGSNGNEASSSNSIAPAPRTSQRIQTDNPCGIFERIIQTITDTFHKETGTAFRRYQIIGSITALCKDPVKWFNEGKNADELNFRLENLSDLSILKPELEKIALSYASLDLLETIFIKPNKAGINRPNAPADAATNGSAAVGGSAAAGRSANAFANVSVNADSKKLEHEGLSKELKKEFLQTPALQRIVDRIFESVFPGFANAVNLDSINLAKAFARTQGSFDFKGKMFKIEHDLNRLLEFTDKNDSIQIQESLRKIIAVKFIDGPGNIAESLLKFKEERADVFLNISEEKDASQLGANILYSAVDSAIEAIEERKLKKQSQEVVQPLSKKITQPRDQGRTVNNATGIFSLAQSTASTAALEEIIRNEIEPWIADLASDTMPFDQELQLANNFFRAIDRAEKISVEKSQSFDTDLVKKIFNERLKKIFNERLGGSKKHISTFAFHKAATTWLKQRPDIYFDRSKLANIFTDNNLFPKSTGPEGRLSILVDRYFGNFLDTLNSAENKKNVPTVKSLAAAKLIRELKVLKAPLGEMERESLANLIEVQVNESPDISEYLKNKILGYRE